MEGGGMDGGGDGGGGGWNDEWWRWDLWNMLVGGGYRFLYVIEIFWCDGSFLKKGKGMRGMCVSSHETSL